MVHIHTWIAYSGHLITATAATDWEAFPIAQLKIMSSSFLMVAIYLLLVAGVEALLMALIISRDGRKHSATGTVDEETVAGGSSEGEKKRMT